MWLNADGIFTVSGFPLRVFVTTTACGDMKTPARREAMCARHGIDAGRLTLCRQVHGARAAVVTGADAGTEVDGTDALVTGLRGTALGVFTADCVPVFIAAKNGSCGGVIHAGWRGIEAGVIEAAVRQMSAACGVKPAGMAAAVGPHIQPCCYTVGPDVLRRFDQRGPTLDLAAAVAGRLRREGVTEIDACGRCTCHEADLFYSHRRDAAVERMLSVVVL